MERIIAEERTVLYWDDETGKLSLEVLRGEEVLARVADIQPDLIRDVFAHPYFYAALSERRAKAEAPPKTPVTSG